MAGVASTKAGGLAFVNINFEDGHGLIKPKSNERRYTDVKNVQELLNEYGVQTEIKKDVSTTQMVTETEKYFKKPEIANMESFWFFISSHGGWDFLSGAKQDVIYGVKAWDKMTIPFFTEKVHSCTPKNKPVVIILQCCRGGHLPHVEELTLEGGKVTDVKDLSAGEPGSIRTIFKVPDVVPIWKNQILLWSTTPGHFAFSDALFRELSDVLSNKHKLAGLDIEDVFIEVIQKVAEDYKSNVPSTPALHERKITPVMYSMLLDTIKLVE